MAYQQGFPESGSPQITLLAGAVYILLILAGTAAAIGLTLRTLHVPLDWDSRIQWLRDRPWSWRTGLGVTAMIGLLVCLTTAISSCLTHPRETSLILLQGLLVDLTGLVAIAAVISSKDWEWRSAFGMTSRPLQFLKPATTFYLALMPFVLFSSLVYQGILFANGYPPSLQDIALLISGDHPLWLRVFMIFLAIVIAPLFEECLFRGILLPLVIRRLGLGTGIFAVSLIFASIHVHLPSLIPLTVVAVGFSLAYLYSKSLWVPIIMHGLFNGVNLALLIFVRH